MALPGALRADALLREDQGPGMPGPYRAAILYRLQ